MPPAELTEPHPFRYAPAPDLATWMREVFIEQGAPLENPDHANLEHADIAVLWTNEENARKGRRLIGRAQLAEPQGSNTWGNGKKRQQLERWFGRVPDFLITLDAVWLTEQLKEGRPAAACALVEHELYHCRQKRNRWGDLSYTMDGRPRWTIAPHDVEEFVGVVRRYGAENTGDNTVAELVEAANKGPEIGAAELGGICGTCLQKVA